MKNQKHFIFFFDSLTLGGAERYGLYLAYHLKAKGHKITILAFKHDSEPDLEKFFFDGPLDYQQIPYGFSKSTHAYRIIQLVKLIPKIRVLHPDIILSFTVRPNIICGAIWKFTGAQKHIWNQQDEGFGLSANKRDKILVRSLKQATFMVSNSAKGIEKLKELVNQNTHSKIKYIPNGIPPVDESKLSKNYWRDILKINREDFVVVKLANLTSYKDHKTVIRAWKIFIDKIENKKNAYLLLAGRKGDTYEEVNGLINELGLQFSVFILGQINKVNELLIDCNIAIHSSPSEGLPNSVIECMNIGLPLIATEIDGHIEALTKNHPLYFKTGDHIELSKKIELCYEKKIDLNIITEVEQTIIKKKYAIDNLYSAFDKLLFEK